MISSQFKHKISKEISSQIFRCSKLNQTSITLKDLYKFGSNPTSKTLFFSSQFLQKEMPIRFAKQVALIDKFPYGLCLMPSIRKIREWYLESFHDLYDFRLTTTEHEEEFTRRVSNIIERHSQTLFVMGRGVFELKQELQNNLSGKDDLSDCIEIHEALNEFYLKRIGIRTLLEHHVQISKQINQKNDEWCGIIQKNCSPVKLVQEVADETKLICERVHGDSPNVIIHGNINDTFPYVPSHLYYIVMELLKNSMRATMEFHSKGSKIPNIDIIITDGETKEDVSIKISDRGGGIPRSLIKKIFSYMYSTGNFDFSNLDSFKNQPILAGMGNFFWIQFLGYGLPVAKCYAKYFHGKLELMSLEGYGTDAYLYLNRKFDSNEPLQ